MQSSTAACITKGPCKDGIISRVIIELSQLRHVGIKFATILARPINAVAKLYVYLLVTEHLEQRMYSWQGY